MTTALPALATGRYYNPKLKGQETWVAVGITAGAPRFPPGYPIAAVLPALAPSRAMLARRRAGGTWEAFVAELRAQLDAVGIDEIARQLRRVSEAHDGRGLVLLCYEDLTDPTLHCHRRVVAEWLEAATGQRVDEIEDDGAKRPTKRPTTTTRRRAARPAAHQPGLFD